MHYIFQTGPNTDLILYPMGEHIIVRNINRDILSHPAYLVSDYAAGLSTAILDKKVYYSYITKSGCLALYPLTIGKAPLPDETDANPFILLSDELCKYTGTQLIVFNNDIVLIYSRHESAENTYTLGYCMPYGSSRQTHTLLSGLSVRPVYSVISNEKHLIIDIDTNVNDSLWELSSDHKLTCYNRLSESLKEKTVIQLNKIKSLNDDINNLRNAGNLMINKINTLSDENDKLKKALTIREYQIESAKKQYNELMDVASRYRDEAYKWRKKFATKKTSQ